MIRRFSSEEFYRHRVYGENFLFEFYFELVAWHLLHHAAHLRVAQEKKRFPFLHYTFVHQVSEIELVLFRENANGEFTC